MLLLTTAGCGGGGGEDVEKGPITMGKVPAAVAKAARDKLGGVAFDSAMREKTGKKDVYSLSGKDKAGKVHTVEVSRDGKVLSAN